MTASSREVKIANREAIWCQVKKKEFLDDPTFMKTHKLLEHPVVTHTKFDKRILLLQCWRHKLGYLVSKFWRSVQYLQALLNTLCTKTDNRHGTLKKKRQRRKKSKAFSSRQKRARHAKLPTGCSHGCSVLLHSLPSGHMGWLGSWSMYKKEKREDTGEVSRRLNMHAKKKWMGGKDIETNGKSCQGDTRRSRSATRKG